MLRLALRGLGVLAALGLPALTLSACVQRPALMIETSSGDVVPLETWTAALAAPGSQLRGTAMLAPGVTYRETQATLSLTGTSSSASAVTTGGFSSAPRRTLLSPSIRTARGGQR